MNVIISGTRTCHNMVLLREAINESNFPITRIITGDSEEKNGVDHMACEVARIKRIECLIVYADWTTYGKSAGPIRNSIMANYGDALIAIWDGKSKGTADMIEKARKKKLQVYIHKA